MRFQFSTLLAVASATCAIAAPSFGALESWSQSSGGKSALHHTSPRPNVECHPKTPHNPKPSPPPRTKTCYVKSHNDGVTDDSEYFLDALHDCNYGGHVVLPEGTKYIIGTALDLTFLNHIDIGKNTLVPLNNIFLTQISDIQGYVQFTNDTAYWQANSFKFGFQNVTSFFKLGGDDVFIYGKHHFLPASFFVTRESRAPKHVFGSLAPC